MWFRPDGGFIKESRVSKTKQKRSFGVSVLEMRVYHGDGAMMSLII